MSEKDLIASVSARTNEINNWFARVNPFTLGNTARQEIQPLVDSVREIAMDVRVALRNYDTVMSERKQKDKRIEELEQQVSSYQMQLDNIQNYSVAAE